MNNNMEYKGYLGSVEFSEEEAVFFGKIMNIRSLISYEGKNVMELSEQFRDAVGVNVFVGKKPLDNDIAAFVIDIIQLSAHITE